MTTPHDAAERPYGIALLERQRLEREQRKNGPMWPNKAALGEPACRQCGLAMIERQPLADHGDDVCASCELWEDCFRSASACGVIVEPKYGGHAVDWFAERIGDEWRIRTTTYKGRDPLYGGCFHSVVAVTARGGRRLDP